ncbi:MAG TPA: hypothetical protein VN894_09060 [Polyangiaceae bacterium]|nr:hypothetical protein [Polyangiaceae bacterium]
MAIGNGLYDGRRRERTSLSRSGISSDEIEWSYPRGGYGVMFKFG